MAAPTSPSQQYDFQDFSISNPTGQQAGDKLDVEFAHHRSTIDTIINFVRTQIADNGYLKARTVDLDMMAQDVLATLSTTWTPRGDWAATTVYAVADLVTFTDNVVYVCLTAHTAGVFVTDRDTNGYWMTFADTAIAIAAEITTQFNAKITVSTLAPSAGVNGDIWFKVAT